MVCVSHHCLQSNGRIVMSDIDEPWRARNAIEPLRALL